MSPVGRDAEAGRRRRRVDFPRPWRRTSSTRQQGMDQSPQGRKARRSPFARLAACLRLGVGIRRSVIADHRRIARSFDPRYHGAICAPVRRSASGRDRASVSHHHRQSTGRNPAARQAGAAMISEEDTDKYLAEVLEILKERFEGGDKTALLYAIHHCLLMKRPLPEWLRLAFLHTYQAHARFEIRSWDQMFGRPVPKSKHLKTERRNAELRPLII